MEWMFSVDGEVEEEPTTDAVDIQERLAARRLRINKRRENRTQEVIVEVDESEEPVRQSHGMHQIDASRNFLEHMEEDIHNCISNVATAYSKRETVRKASMAEEARELKEKMDSEVKNANERYDEILRKWELLKEKQVAREMTELIDQQNEACSAVMYEKDKLISDLEQELKAKEEVLVKDLSKQSTDLHEITHRMKDEYGRALKGYNRELKNVESAFLREREELREEQDAKWKKLFERKKNREDFHIFERLKRLTDHDRKLAAEMKDICEDYFDLKIKLFKDVDTLQLQLEKTRAAYMLGVETLEYNFQVIAKREQENQMIKTLQKRKFTRNSDYLTQLKSKVAKQAKAFKQENNELTADLKRYTRLIEELQHISYRFHAEDMRNFAGVWIMNEDKCKQLFYLMEDSNKIVMEQILGLIFTPSKHPILANVGPIISEKQKKAKGAHQILEKIFSEAASAGDNVNPASPYMGKDVKQPSISGRLLKPEDKFSYVALRNLLELVCDEAGFIVEQKLVVILAEIPKDNRCLMTLDAIFSALKLTSEEDIQLLARYFTAFAAEEDYLDKELVIQAPDSDSEVFESDEGTRHGSQVEGRASQFEQEKRDSGMEAGRPSTVSRTSMAPRRDTDLADRPRTSSRTERRRSSGSGAVELLYAAVEQPEKRSTRTTSVISRRHDADPEDVSVVDDGTVDGTESKQSLEDKEHDKDGDDNRSAAYGSESTVSTLPSDGRRKTVQRHGTTTGSVRRETDVKVKWRDDDDKSGSSYSEDLDKDERKVSTTDDTRRSRLDDAFPKQDDQRPVVRRRFQSELGTRDSTLVAVQPQRSASMTPEIGRLRSLTGDRRSIMAGVSSGDFSSFWASSGHPHVDTAVDLPPHMQERQPGKAHANDVVKVLKRFLNDLRFTRDTGSQIDNYFLAQYDGRDEDADSRHWKTFLEVSRSAIREELWDVLLESFQDYHELLRKRKVASAEAMAIANQNEELKYLLLNYVTSKVNNEFMVPPIHAMHTADIESLTNQYYPSVLEDGLEYEIPSNMPVPVSMRNPNVARGELLPSEHTL